MNPSSKQPMPDLIADAALDPDIRFDGPLAGNPESAESIFLTGATGFLGVFLLHELLRETHADLYCLVRCGAPEKGMERIVQALRFYSLWKDRFGLRIKPVPGDLSRPLLGLTARDFSEYAERMEVIYHNGAHVNVLYPYSRLKPANVDGTRELIRLAGQGRRKPLHFVSTLAVFFNRNMDVSRVIQEDDTPDPDVAGGYKQSKWVAERLVRDAASRGLPASVYRIARIVGDSRYGINGNLNDFLVRLIRGCILSGCYPDSAAMLNLIPADYAGRAIVYLSRLGDSAGKTFHILNPHPVSWNDFFERIRESGYRARKIPLDDWTADIAFRARHADQDSCFVVLNILMRSVRDFFSEKPKIDARHTFEALRGASFACPPADRRLVATYLSYFRKSGDIPPPGSYG